MIVPVSKMNELLKSTSLKSANGDATFTYNCELARYNITVREFVEAVKNSVNNCGQMFKEWWAVVSMSIIGQYRFPACAEYTIYGNTSDNCFRDISLNGTPATIDDILSHYGEYIINSCQWNGGWGSGGYYLKIKKEEIAR